MSADFVLCLTSLLVIVEWSEFLLIILEDLNLGFLLVDNNDSFLGFAKFFEEYPLTMTGVHK
jgi:hypothetical protein